MKDISTLHIIKKPSLLQWLWGLLVVVVTFACRLTGQIGLYGLLPYHTLFYGAVTPFLLSYFEKYSRVAVPSLKVFAGILAILFSQFVTIEGSFHQVHSWALCFGSNLSILIWIARSLVYAYVFYKCLLGILVIIEKQNVITSEKYHINFQKWFLIIVFIRLVTLFLFYPCVFGFDAAVGLRTFMDPDCATCDHHPYSVQLVHSLFFTLGKKIGHISIGFAILSLLSILFSSAIIIYGLKLLIKTQISRRWLLFIASVYALFPLYPYLSIYPTKDGFFAYAFLLYIFTLYDLYLTAANCIRSARFITLHTISILLVCLTRHQGIYIIIIESFILLYCYRQQWKRTLLVTYLPICLFLAYNNLLLPWMNVEPGGKQEKYGMLFQQTAYYLKQHPQDVTNTELAAINRILDCDTIVAKYTFNSTDAVKNRYKYNPWYRVFPDSPSMFRHIDHANEEKDLKDYCSAWRTMGLRHPLTYLEAALNVSAGFFYNGNRLILETEPKWAINNSAATPEYKFAHFTTVARIYNNRIYSLFKVPFINWIIAIAYYNWIAIFLTALLFYRKDTKGLSIFLPVVVSLGILLVCPMIYGRYSYPIVMAIPFLLIYVLSSKDLAIRR